MENRLEILQGEGKPGYIGTALKIGGATLGFAGKSIRFGFSLTAEITAEIGETLMYHQGQEGYANALKVREPRSVQ